MISKIKSLISKKANDEAEVVLVESVVEHQEIADAFLSESGETTISDIVKQANVAKGTFYLYFKDKYDIRNKLISYKANQLLLNAHEDLINNHPEITDIKDQIVHLMIFIVYELNENFNHYSFTLNCLLLTEEIP